MYIFGQRYREEAGDAEGAAGVPLEDVVSADDLNSIIDEVIRDNGDEVPEPPAKEPVEAPDEVTEEAEEVAEEAADETSETTSEEDSASDGDAVTEAPEPSDEDVRKELLDVVQSYGLPAEEAEGFRTASEFRRAMEFLDRQTVAQAKKPEQPKTEPESKPDPEPEKPATTDLSSHPVIVAKNEEFAKRVAYFKEQGYEESLIEVLTLQHEEAQEARKHALSVTSIAEKNQQQSQLLLDKLNAVQGHVEAQQQAAIQTQQRQEAGAFYQNLDALGHPDLFGSDGQSTQEQRDNCVVAWQNAQALAAQLRAGGKQVNLNRAFVERAARMSFGRQFDQKEQAERSRRVQKQARGIMGSGRPAKGKAETIPFTGDPETDPVFRQKLAELRESGQYSG